jgi:hypothetical protein
MLTLVSAPAMASIVRFSLKKRGGVQPATSPPTEVEPPRLSYELAASIVFFVRAVSRLRGDGGSAEAALENTAAQQTARARLNEKTGLQKQI